MIHHLPGPAGVLEALVDDPRSLCTTASPPSLSGLRRTSPPEAAATAPSGGESDAWRVETPTAAVVVAHPHPQYGGTMHTKVVFQAAKAFCRLGCAVLRFNFRGVGVSAGAFSGGEGELDDYRACLDFMAARFPGVPLWAAGVSFGSWVAMTAGARDDRVTTLVGIAVPSKLYDFSAVSTSAKPKFFIHGEHDELCPLRGVRELYGRSSEPKELAVIDGADHLFDGHVSEVADAITDLLG
jgi:alpha/beta superfamily hydrolase